MIFEVFLGILTAMGGFVEIGELVFVVNAGAKFGTSLAWVIVLGTVGIIVYGEMAGRVAAVAKQPVFDIVRERVGFNAGLGTLLAANAVSLLACAAEIGGVAIILKYLLGWPYRLLILAAALLLVVLVWTLAFKWIERFFGLLGLLMVVFLVAAVKLHPDWGQLAGDLVPNLPSFRSGSEGAQYAYFVVTILSSVMFPYETYFYSSGAIEDRWQKEHVLINRVVVTIGFVLGAVLALGLMVIGAHTLQPARVEPQWPGAAVLGATATMGQVGLTVGLLGMLFAFGGAAVENALTGAYNLAQFLGWPWGKFRPPARAPRFALAWIGMFLVATLIVLTGISPVAIVEITIVLAILVLPLTYLPLLLAAADAGRMGRFANGRIANTLGWFFLVIVTLAGLAALPLYILTHGGKA